MRSCTGKYLEHSMCSLNVIHYYEHFSLNIFRSNRDCGLDLSKSKCFSRAFSHFQGPYFQKVEKNDKEPGVRGTETPIPGLCLVWQSGKPLLMSSLLVSRELEGSKKRGGKSKLCQAEREIGEKQDRAVSGRDVGRNRGVQSPCGGR